MAIVAAPSASAVAQTNAAAMAVRQRVEGSLPEGPESPHPPGAPTSSPPGMTPGAADLGKIDLKYIAPKAALIAVVRPAQILASPIAQVFPVEALTAASMQSTGYDATEMEEIVAFGDMSAGQNYGVTFKFKNPIRASSIPAERRAHAQLAELAGKKYLRSGVPTLPSLYGPNNRTLVAATEASLQQLVESAGQPKSGPLVDRIREVPGGNDLYLAVDVAALGPMVAPFLQIGLAQARGVPPEVKEKLGSALSMISAVELTLNVSAPGPTTLVIHCNDETGAQTIEAALTEAMQKATSAAPGEQPGMESPVAQAMTRYKERMRQPFTPQRNGTSITCIHIDGHNPQQQELVKVAIVGVAGAMLTPAIQAARKAQAKNAAAAAAGAPAGPESPAGPGPGPGPGPSSPEGGTP